MKIVLLGANGRTGRLVVRQALASGHTVTGLVRSADSLKSFQHERLTVENGDVSDPAFLRRVFRGHDAVVSTVGPRATSKAACSIYPDSAAAIVEAMLTSGLKRVLVTSTALLFPPSGIIDHVVHKIAKNNQEAAASMEALISNADLDYTFVRPGFLTDRNDPEFFRTAGAAPKGGRSVSRLALANFIVSELDRSDHVGGVVGLSSRKAA